MHFGAAVDEKWFNKTDFGTRSGGWEGTSGGRLGSREITFCGGAMLMMMNDDDDDDSSSSSEVNPAGRWAPFPSRGGHVVTP